MKINNILNKIKKGGLKDGSFLKNKNGGAEIKDKRNKPIVFLRLLSFFIIFLLILSLMLTVIFVYSSITNSIGQIQSIASYQSEARVGLIDFVKLDKVEKYWEEKVQSELPTIKRNPFIEPFSPLVIEIQTVSTTTSTTNEIIEDKN